MTSIGAAQSIAQVAGSIGPERPGSTSELQPGGVSFADTLKQALGDVTALQTNAEDAIGAFLSGQPIEIHEVMAAAEEAGIALEMLIEIRNKLTEAYRTVSQMQQ